jgi:SGNH domain (fused to AT3 domains)
VFSIKNVHLIKPEVLLCPSSNQFCILKNTTTGHAYYKDHNHLTRAGSLKLVPLYEKIWDK